VGACPYTPVATLVAINCWLKIFSSLHQGPYAHNRWNLLGT
jgi:hypothetical protein